MKLPLYIYVTAAYAFVFSAKLRVNVDDTAGAYYAEFGTGDLSRESIAQSLWCVPFSNGLMHCMVYH